MGGGGELLNESMRCGHALPPLLLLLLLLGAGCCKGGWRDL